VGFTGERDGGQVQLPVAHGDGEATVKGIATTSMGVHVEVGGKGLAFGGEVHDAQVGAMYNLLGEAQSEQVVAVRDLAGAVFLPVEALGFVQQLVLGSAQGIALPPFHRLIFVAAEVAVVGAGTVGAIGQVEDSIDGCVRSAAPTVNA